MIEALWIMAKTLFFFGILPAGILAVLYVVFNKAFDLRKSIETIIKNNKTEVGNVTVAFTWLCFIGFIIWIIIKLV
jgi:TRAP-type C4-dicarboxylate transport system permease large subunit